MASSKLLGTYADASNNDVVSTVGAQTIAGIKTFSDGLVPSSSLMFRNRIINGDMRIAQRATTSTSQGYTTVDRFFVNRSGGVSGLTITQALGAFGANKYSLALQRNNGNSNTAAINVYQPIEGVNCRDLAGKSVTASFQVGSGAISSTTGHSIALYYQTTTTDIGISGSWTLVSSQAITIAAATSFTQKTATFSVPSNAKQLMLVISLAVAGTAGADDRFYLTEIQLESGSAPTPFEFRPIGTELSLCQRYFEVSGSMPAITNFQELSTSQIFTTVRYQVPKRAIASITTSSQAYVVTGTSSMPYQITGNNNFLDGVIDQSTVNSFVFKMGTSPGVNRGCFSWSANSELI